MTTEELLATLRDRVTILEVQQQAHTRYQTTMEARLEQIQTDINAIKQRLVAFAAIASAAGGAAAPLLTNIIGNWQ